MARVWATPAHSVHSWADSAQSGGAVDSTVPDRYGLFAKSVARADAENGR